MEVLKRRLSVSEEAKKTKLFETMAQEMGLSAQDIIETFLYQVAMTHEIPFDINKAKAAELAAQLAATTEALIPDDKIDYSNIKR